MKQSRLEGCDSFLRPGHEGMNELKIRQQGISSKDDAEAGASDALCGDEVWPRGLLR